MPSKKEELESVQPKTEVSETASAADNKPKEEAKAKTDPKPKAGADTKPAVEAKAEVTTETGKTKSDLVKLPKLNMSSDMKGTAIKVGIGAVAAVALALTAFGVLVYVYQSENAVVRGAAKVVPYPVEQVNGSLITYNDYLFEVDANKRAYQNNAKLNNQPAVDFESADGKKMLAEIRKHALDKLKSDAIVAQLAKEKKVAVSNKDVDGLINELYKRYGGKETLLKTLDQIYGWKLGDLKRVVYKQLLAQKLEEKVTGDPKVQEAAKTKATDVLNKVKAGGDFAEIAKQYSQASDASSGGDLGTVAKGQLPEEQQKAIDALQPGQVSDLVKTQYGYEIIKVTEKDGDNAKVMHILVKTVDFNEYFKEQRDKAKTKALIKV